MKILFVTGGGDCECKGEGVVEALPRGCTRYLRTLCKCVVAKEAMAIKPERSVEGGNDYYVVILPKEIGAERVIIEPTLETDVRLKQE